MIDEVSRHLEDLIAAGVIRKSSSPWALPLALCLTVYGVKDAEGRQKKTT